MTIVEPVAVAATVDDIDHWVCCVEESRTFCGAPNDQAETIAVAFPLAGGCVVCDDLARVTFRTRECPITHGPCVSL